MAILFSTYTAGSFADGSTQAVGFETWTKCSSLQAIEVPATAIGLPTQGAVVTKAMLIPGGLVNPLGEYCLIDGAIAPVDPRAQEIKFTVAMPSRWNGKMVHFGGAGWNGFVISPLSLGPQGPEGNQVALTAPPPPLARGYVTFGSDSGHEIADGMDPASFLLNDEQRHNFAGDQLKKTHDVVMYLVKARYGSEPVRSYFLGGSKGGNEGLTVMQQFPADYDGVVTLAPAIGVTARMMKNQLIKRDIQLNNGIGWISRRKAEFLRRIEVAACDRLDGLEDSIISNVDACRIDLDKLRCPGGKDTDTECFSDAQLKTLSDLGSQMKFPYALSDGGTTEPGSAPGTDWDSPYLFSSDKSGTVPITLDESDIRYRLLRDPEANVLSFDPLNPGKTLAQVRECSELYDRTSLDMDGFMARGGKWIVFHGQSDELISPRATIHYYQRLVSKYGQGKVDALLRLYLIPGFGHGRGFAFDAEGAPALDALEDWVERGIVPATLTVVDASPQAHGRSRPMCVYPGWPKFNGIGDPNLASSFTCVVGK
jgi:feruloyl esterase